MKLIDLLEVFDENKNLVVFRNDVEVSRYDGKDSINEIYNDCEIIEISPVEENEMYALYAFIK